MRYAVGVAPAAGAPQFSVTVFADISKAKFVGALGAMAPTEKLTSLDGTLSPQLLWLTARTKYSPSGIEPPMDVLRPTSSTARLARPGAEPARRTYPVGAVPETGTAVFHESDTYEPDTAGVCSVGAAAGAHPPPP